MRRRYHLVIVLCCFLVLFINQGLPATSFNVFQSYLVALPGVGDVGGSLVLTVRTLVSLVALLFVGVFYRRVSLRAGVALATLLTAAGFGVYSQAQGLPLLCLGSVLTGLGYGFGGMVATTMLIGNWYRGHIGTVVGVAAMGSGVASIVMPVAAAALIARFDLATAFRAEALLALGLGAVAVGLLRSRPQDVGLAPTQEDDPLAQRRRRRVRVGTSTLPPADKRLMLVALTLLGAVAIVGNGYFSVLLTSSGVSLGTAAALTAVLGCALTVSKLACGWVLDAAGSTRGSLAFFALLIAGLVLCCLVGPGGDADGFFAAVLYGLGVAVATTGVSVWALELSAPADRLGLLRDFQVAYAFGGFAFNLAPGLIANATGGYAASYALLGAMAVACAAIVGVVYRRHDRRAR